MIKSMTGFGRCEIQKGSRKFTVELKSVNHRYLDVSIRMPKKLNFFETAIRTLLKSYANRGKVDIFITYEDLSQSQVSVKYNAALAAEYLRYLRQMEEEFGLENDVSVSTLSARRRGGALTADRGGIPGEAGREDERAPGGYPDRGQPDRGGGDPVRGQDLHG